MTPCSHWSAGSTWLRFHVHFMVLSRVPHKSKYLLRSRATSRDYAQEVRDGSSSHLSNLCAAASHGLNLNVCQPTVSGIDWVHPMSTRPSIIVTHDMPPRWHPSTSGTNDIFGTNSHLPTYILDPHHPDHITPSSFMSHTHVEGLPLPTQTPVQPKRKVPTP